MQYTMPTQHLNTVSVLYIWPIQHSVMQIQCIFRTREERCLRGKSDGSKILNWATGVRFPGRSRRSGARTGPFGTGDEGELTDGWKKSQKHTHIFNTTQHWVTIQFLSFFFSFILYKEGEKWKTDFRANW